MLIRSRGEYAEQNAGVNTKTAGMMKVACMTTSFQMPQPSTPFLWSDAWSANITTIAIHTFAMLLEWTARMIQNFSVLTENGEEDKNEDD